MTRNRGIFWTLFLLLASGLIKLWLDKKKEEQKANARRAYALILADEVPRYQDATDALIKLGYPKKDAVQEVKLLPSGLKTSEVVRQILQRK